MKRKESQSSEENEVSELICEPGLLACPSSLTHSLLFSLPALPEFSFGYATGYIRPGFRASFRRTYDLWRRGWNAPRHLYSPENSTACGR